MPMSELVIAIEDLPLRAHQLDMDELSAIFGGCGGEGAHCGGEKDDGCCPGYYCGATIAGTPPGQVTISSCRPGGDGGGGGGW